MSKQTIGMKIKKKILLLKDGKKCGFDKIVNQEKTTKKS